MLSGRTVQFRRSVLLFVTYRTSKSIGIRIKKIYMLMPTTMMMRMRFKKFKPGLGTVDCTLIV